MNKLLDSMLKVAYHIILLIVLASLLIREVSAQPQLASSVTVVGQKLYKDSRIPNLWYYQPPDYQLMNGGDGKPSLSLLQMRYTGTVAAGDNGLVRTNNIFQFRIGIDTAYQKKLYSLQQAVKKEMPGSQLRILPVRKFSSILVFSGTGSSSGIDSLSVIKNSGYAEATDENAEINNSYWNERVVTFRLNDMDAQAVAAALNEDKVILSFGYAFYSLFSDSANSSINTNAGGELKNEIRRMLSDENKGDSNIILIKADAIPLKADVAKWPSVVEKIDINENLPAKFPVFTVYCYDFNNGLRDDLFAKKIEVKARSVSGADIESSFTFLQAKPELFARNIRFKYAVRFDRPFYYRTTEINNDGEATSSEWIKRESWTELIDITSPPEKTVRKGKPEEGE
ncbi:MAG TPA: hypothetical protein PKA77_04210 [Chitinophagaceae bacterium]|nr:hypothetical protein [Chitinophagaceae bacterium]HMU57949.1 hypothetical protein [Chitinophagaceae bacterium]